MQLVTSLSLISILVQDQDTALKFYTDIMGLEKCLDITYAPGLRLVTVAPRGQRKPQLALAKPGIYHDEAWMQDVLRRMDPRNPWMFATNNCGETYEKLTARGVHFLQAPTRQLYGIEARFTDPDENMFALLEPFPEARSLCLARCIGTAA